MSTLDILILIAAAIGLITGMIKGLVRQIGSLAAIVIGILACRAFGANATSIMASILPQGLSEGSMGQYIPSVLGNIALFLIVYIAVILIARALSTLTHAIFLGPVDRTAGALFGLTKWLLLASILINVWLTIVPQAEISGMAGGRLAQFTADIFPWMMGVMLPQ